MLDKKQIWAIFLFRFKMGCKAVETTHNINNAFGPRTANKCTVQWWFKKFCKGDESLKDEESSGWPFKVDKDQLKESSKLVLLQPHEKLQKNSLSTILTSFSICSKLGRWKSSISGCLISWLKIKKNKNKNKNIILRHHLLFYAPTMNNYSIRLWHARKYAC